MNVKLGAGASINLETLVNTLSREDLKRLDTLVQTRTNTIYNATSDGTRELALRVYLETDSKIKAIKAVREASGMWLRDAKDIVDGALYEHEQHARGLKALAEELERDLDDPET